jgi:hypothetical protein
MSLDPPVKCARCGASLAGDGAYCRIYRDAETLSFCSAACALAFVQVPSKPMDDRALTALQQHVSDWRWKRWG